MTQKKRNVLIGLCVATLMLAACGKDAPTGSTGKAAETQAGAKMPAPVFSLTWSEYPSWSVFGAAAEKGIIDPDEGEMSALEKEHDVDIVLHEKGYDASITMYGSGQTDAVTITNMDVLSPSVGMRSVAIMPTSTSAGGDCLLTTKDITSLSQLKGKKVFGLSKSVSEYAFNRLLEASGENPAEYAFEHQDPEAATLAMQQRQDGHDAIMVWNPFCIDTLSKRSDVHVLSSSVKMPGEIIDMVVVSEASLQKPGGNRFAMAIIDAYYEMNKILANPSTHDDALMAIGEKFTGIKEPSKMEVILQQTRFYATADQGIAVFAPSSLTPIMEKVTRFCVAKQIVDRAPTIGYGAPTAGTQLRFDASYMEAVKSRQ